MLRFRPNDLPEGAQDQVQIQFKPADGSADWAPIGDPIPVTNGKGFFTGQVTAPAAGSIRASWTDPATGFSVTSRTSPIS
jgi:hypothetical protein